MQSKKINTAFCNNPFAAIPQKKSRLSAASFIIENLVT